MLANQLTSVSRILGISDDDAEKVEILTILFEMVESAVCLRIAEATVPKALEWLVNEVVIKRYQLLGAEHLQSEGIDVISSTYKAGGILDEYTQYLDDYISNIQAKTEEGVLTSKRKLRML